jgi:thiosulfate dehydrogenase [quinone] large subunit
MSLKKKIVLLFLRLAMGWLMFYSGITKILDSEWSAKSYLLGAKIFPNFYAWFSQDSILPVVNFVNEWGLTIIGAALILGFFTKPAAFLGAVLMMLYYFPVLDYPSVGLHAFIIDEHIIFALSFLVIFVFSAGKYWGVDSYRR